MDRTPTRRRLEEAAGTGEILTIVYEGGTQPGSKRDILVEEIGDTKFRAFDMAMGHVKTYFVHKASVVDPAHRAPSYVALPEKEYDRASVELKRRRARPAETEEIVLKIIVEGEGMPQKAETPELQELRKHTRVMAQKAAGKGWMYGFVGAGMVAYLLAKAFPETAAFIPWWGYLLFMVVLGLGASRSAYDEVVQGR